MNRIPNRLLNFKHISLWIFMYVFIFDYHFWEGNWREAIQLTSSEVVLYGLIFYSNYRIAIPFLLNSKRYFWYCCSLFLFYTLYIIAIKSGGIEHQLYEGSELRNLISMTINFILFWLISTLFWYFEKTRFEQEQRLLLKTEKLETEMKFLKNQISPHFIFNTLNNIYALVQQGHANAAPMLAKLSEILRYLLYESTREYVPLEKELLTIKQYIRLQLLRQPVSENVDFYQEGALKDFQIPPLILLSFVENCFKHSNIDQTEEAWIKISCNTLENNWLYFITENSSSLASKSNSNTGLGNHNIQRQLELLYPNQHELKIEQRANSYHCELKICLHQPLNEDQ